MTYKSLIRKLKLKNEDLEEIKAAVQKAETATTGEIVVAVAPESEHYSFWELLFANVFSALVIFAMFPFSEKIKGLYSILYWRNEPSWILPIFFIITYLCLVIITFYLTNIAALDRLIIPRAERRLAVTNRAFRLFTETNVYCTKEHTGILIFVSYMEHQVRILADKGISDKISQDMWNMIADEMSDNLKNKNIKLAFINAVEKCGQLLADNFPNHQENPNELSDGLIIVILIVKI